MVLEKVRSYREQIVEQLFEMEDERKQFLVHRMGGVPYSSVIDPLSYVTIGNKRDSHLKDVLISAGIHGEEPAGVYALLKFLKEGVPQFRDHYRFLVFPCINTFGFECNHRYNSQPDPDIKNPERGMDINRQFKKGTQCREAINIMRVLERKKRRFICHIDLHETDPNWACEGFSPEDNPRTFYMWETCSDKSLRIGDKVVAEVEGFAPVCKWPFIYKDINNGGVIWYPEGCNNSVYAEGSSFESFTAARYTSQSFTLETPCGWSINQRVFVHNLAIRKILELKKDA